MNVQEEAQAARKKRNSSVNANPATNSNSKKTRTRSGCLSCRRRRRKCDELRPQCINCQQRGELCEWGLKITFRDDNATQIEAEHPSMLEGSRKRARHFKIVDVTPQFEKTKQSGTSADVAASENGSIDTVNSESKSQSRTYFHRQHVHPELETPTTNIKASPQYQLAWHSASPAFDTPSSISVSYPDDLSFQTSEDHIHTVRSPETDANSTHGREGHGLNHTQSSQQHTIPMLEHRRFSENGSSSSRINTEDAAADLLALRYMPLQQHSRGSDHSPQMLMPPPLLSNFLTDANEPHILGQGLLDYEDDGIFLPGSAFREFHSTLRDHLIYTAKSNAPTRYGTPELHYPEPSIRTSKPDENSHREDSDPKAGRVSELLELTPQREYVLWKAWIDELAPWLDKFDNQRHFEMKIPMMARSTSHLKNSILALSARQIEMKENSKSSSESLALYQEAIHLLLPSLQTKGTAVIASCVILCVLEMMSCSPTEWRRHLEGCANLLEAVGINGFVGGVEEALFWCFVRMDLCGALISQDLTLIPVERWASNIDFASDIRLFRNPANDFDTYANYAVFLCANCVAYLKNSNGQTSGIEASRWTELLGLLDDWYAQRPEEMKPILTIPAAQGEDSSPFPTVFYGNGPAVSGNQLYHTALLLMLQQKPNGIQVSRKQKSIFWHARQICAISESNTHHGAWTNSIQPLWIAGKIMSHPSEHRAILQILERIERDTGWVTKWRRDDLKAWWGEEDE